MQRRDSADCNFSVRAALPFFLQRKNGRLRQFFGIQLQPAALADLARPGTKIVVGDPSVPVGEYTRGVLGRLPEREREAILANVRSEEPEASSVLAKVVDGAADAGFVYATDARTVAGEARAVAIPNNLQPDVAYAAAVLTDSGQPKLARRYLRGLLRGRGATDLREAGFLTPR